MNMGETLKRLFFQLVTPEKKYSLTTTKKTFPPFNSRHFHKPRLYYFFQSQLAVNLQIQQNEIEYDLNRAAELKYGSSNSLRRQLETARRYLDEYIRSGKSMLRDEVTRNDIAKIISRWIVPISYQV